ncbi:MAG: hypothetical protein IJI13_07450 [Oscillospiraceae bacterium]|nr:hypothetical protein [Oscillospiraceae bacterium]
MKKILFTSPKLSVNLAHPMLRELYAELNAQGREFSFLCGHDSTISCVLAAAGRSIHGTRLRKRSLNG